MLDVNRHAWADTAYDLAWTLAVVRGRTEQEILAAYGASDGALLGSMTFDEAGVVRGEHLDEHGVVQLKPHEGYVLAIEPNGWIGNSSDVALKLASPAGAFLSVYWSPSSFQIVQASDGNLTARFDPTFIGLPAGGNDMLPGWVDDDDFPIEHLESASLAAVERVTGVAFDPAWLSEPLPTYRVSGPA